MMIGGVLLLCWG